MTAAEWARWLLIVGGTAAAVFAVWATHRATSAPYADTRREDR